MDEPLEATSNVIGAMSSKEQQSIQLEPQRQLQEVQRFKKLIQQFNAKYFGKDTGDIQRDAMLVGELHYEGQDHEKVTKQLFQINEDLKLFGEDVDIFPIRKMARKVIPHKYVDKGGKELRIEEDTNELVGCISEVLDVEYEMQQCMSNRSWSGNSSNESLHN